MDNLKERLENTGLTREISLHLIKAENGIAIGEIDLEEKHFNVIDTVHGGTYFTLADTIAGSAAASTGAKVTTANSSIEFMRPATAQTKKLICEAKVEKSGKTLIWASAIIKDNTDRILCSFKSIYYRIENVM